MPGFHHSVAVLPLPFPYRVAVAVMPWLVGVDDWLANYGTTGKIELDLIATEERLWHFLPFTAVTERNFLM